MSERIKTASLSWSKEGWLYSRDFGDVYFQPKNGAGESDYVFLQQNNLADRFAALKDGEVFRIAELGFGSGLNFLLTLALWRKNAPKSARLVYLSFEKHPVKKDELQRIYAHWPQLQETAQEFLAQYPPPVAGFHLSGFRGAHLLLGLGDIAELLPQIETEIDAWYLDGFAPSKNPEMWDEKLFAEMARLTVRGGTFSTFTAAGAVRRGLESAGFAVEKRRGFGNKRDMLAGTYAQGREKKSPAPRRAIVIGAGIAGASAAYALAARGVAVTVLEKAEDIASAASGNPVGIVYPRLTAAPSPMGDFYGHAFCHLLRLMQHLGAETGWRQTGALLLDGGDAALKKRYDGIITNGVLTDDMARRVTAKQATEIAGVEMKSDGLFYPDAGMISPRQFCAALLAAFPEKISVKTATAAEEITYKDGIWSARNSGGVLAEAEYMVPASGAALAGFAEAAFLELRLTGGQISYCPANPLSEKLKAVVMQNGYFPPATEGMHYAGATFEKNQKPADAFPVTEAGHRKNLAAWQEFLPQEFFDGLCAGDMQGRGGLRSAVPDYLPVAGACPDVARFALEAPQFHSGLYLCGAFGSHGMTAAPLAGEIIAAQICGDPLPVPQHVAAAVAPERFVIRALKRNRNEKVKIKG